VTFPPGASLGTTLGVLQIGLPLSVCMFGVLTLQVYYYFANYKGDRSYMRWLVRVVWLLELLDVAFLIGTLYRLSITYFRQPDGLQPAFLAMPSQKFLTGALLICGYSNSTIQLIFTCQLQHLVRSWPLTIICAMLSVYQMIIVPFQAHYTTHETILKFAETRKGIVLSTLGAALLLDSLIIAALWSRKLRKERNSLKFSPLRLSFLIGETGIIQWAIGLSTLLALATMNQNYIWLCLRLISSEVYANSLLLSLNGRRAGDETSSSLAGTLQFRTCNTVGPGLHHRPSLKMDGIRVEMTNVTTSCGDQDGESSSIAMEGDVTEGSFYETKRSLNVTSAGDSPVLGELP